MAHKHITQTEARRMKARLAELENWAARKQWDWSTGNPFDCSELYRLTNTNVAWIVQTARRLGHPVVVVNSGDDLIFYGVTAVTQKP